MLPHVSGSPGAAGHHRRPPGDLGPSDGAGCFPLGAGSLGYYRSPAIRGDVIVFVAEGDLWQVARTGGVATRLTSHLGNESHPAISADKTVVAFSAAYEGPTDVYTMPGAGGSPVRRTFEGDAQVVGFAPDGTLLYATGRHSTLPDRQLFRLDLTTGERTPLPLAQAADGCFTSDGSTLFFTRLPFQGSHTKLLSRRHGADPVEVRRPARARPSRSRATTRARARPRCARTGACTFSATVTTR